MEAAAAVAGRNMAASCCIWCWLNPDFLRDSCSPGSKLLLPPSNISRWLGHRIHKGHLCLSSFWLIGMCRPDVVCEQAQPLLSGVLKPQVHLPPRLILLWSFFLSLGDSGLSTTDLFPQLIHDCIPLFGRADRVCTSPRQVQEQNRGLLPLQRWSQYYS